MNQRIDRALRRVLSQHTRGRHPGQGAPPLLKEALYYAVFPGGGRVRPRLCLAVAEALGDPNPRLSETAAVALELLHCASLVHDDLPCFDDAAVRRGKPSVHQRYGEAIALLVGDGLIVMAFGALADLAGECPKRCIELASLVARAAGCAEGIVAGQAWESEEHIDLQCYHRAKTAALFEAATVAGARVAGAPGGPWREVGRLLGEAYQAADDIADALAQSEQLKKPAGQDACHGRPNGVAVWGALGALEHMDALLHAAATAVPQIPGRDGLVGQLAGLAQRLCPPILRQRVADLSALSAHTPQRDCPPGLGWKFRTDGADDSHSAVG